MPRITLRQKLRYRFDNSMSKGTVALIGYLFLISLIMILVVAAIVVVSGIAPEEEGRPKGFAEVAWMSLMRTLDAGTMGGDTGSWWFLIAMFTVTLGGIFIVSTLIGVLTSGIEAKMEELRKGRSLVVEKDHTVVLGWSPQVFTIVSELVAANENQRRGCIAILADKDKVEMEDEIRAKVPDTKNTRVVCRCGSPTDLTDLEIVNPHQAKSIIILSPEGENPDSKVIKTILAITNNPHRRPEPYHVVAEIRSLDNAPLARLVGKGEAQLVLVEDLISRIMVQTCRQAGLSLVYTELLNFGGDEIYFQEEPRLVGKTLGEALFMYEDSCLIGLCFADGRIALNPPLTTRIASGDKIIAISEDDDTVVPSGKTDFGIDESAIREPPPRQKQPERTLILGWNRRGVAMIRELDSYVAPGSQVTVVAERAEVREELLEKCKGLKNQKLSFLQGDTTDRKILEGLQPTAFNHVITLSAFDTLDPQEADSRTLVTLLYLREIGEKAHHPFSITSEMQDVRNRELALVTRADDFIVSDSLVSLMLTQLSENKELELVFQDLFDPEGSEIYLKPAADYVELGREVNFYTVLEAARRRNEIAIGYSVRAWANNPEKGNGVITNPDKSARFTLTAEDRVIVLSESD